MYQPYLCCLLWSLGNESQCFQILCPACYHDLYSQVWRYPTHNQGPTHEYRRYEKFDTSSLTVTSVFAPKLKPPAGFSPEVRFERPNWKPDDDSDGAGAGFDVPNENPVCPIEEDGRTVCSLSLVDFAGAGAGAGAGADAFAVPSVDCACSGLSQDTHLTALSGFKT